MKATKWRAWFYVVAASFCGLALGVQNNSDNWVVWMFTLLGGFIFGELFFELADWVTDFRLSYPGDANANFRKFLKNKPATTTRSKIKKATIWRVVFWGVPICYFIIGERNILPDNHFISVLTGIMFGEIAFNLTDLILFKFTSYRLNSDNDVKKKDE